MHASARRLAPPLVISIIFALCFVGIFTAALHSPKPHDIPVGIVAPAAVHDAVHRGLAQHAAGVFELHGYDNEAAAKAAIADRTIDGALIMTGRAPALLIAGAAGDATTGAITNAFSGIVASQRQSLTIRNLYPFPDHDSHGLAAFFLVAGLVIASIVFQAASFIITKPKTTAEWLAPLVLYSLVAGLLGPLMSALTMWAWPDNFWTLAGLCILLCLAMTSVTAALIRLVGLPGIGLAILGLVMFGNSSSGGPVSYRFLPDLYRQISQFLPAGTSVTAIRNALYFDNAALATPIVVLLCWLAGGIGLLLVAGRRQSRSATSPRLRAEPTPSRV